MRVTFFVPVDQKNNEKNRVDFIKLDEDISIVKVHNEDSSSFQIRGELDPNLIQFYFCTSGSATFSFHHGAYKRELKQQNVMLFYNPTGSLEHELIVEPGTRLLALFISVKRIHELFVQDSEGLSFLDSENVNKKLYASKPLTTPLLMVLDPLFHLSIGDSTRNLYYRGKVYEILSLYFSREGEKTAENCPFLLDESNVEKVRMAKRIMLDRMSNPPALPELAQEVGLNEYQLKVGFKNIYGNTVYKFLTEYRMDQARKMLDTGGYRVNEVGFHIGYSNPSHFIAAFKKKFGVTPKKYLQFIGK